MTYSALPTVATGDLWTAANHNTYVRDNFAAGVPALFTTKGDIVSASASGVASRLGLGTDGQSLIADAVSAGGVKWDTPTILTLISETVVGVAAANITFSSIPATFRHLKIFAYGRGTNASTSINVQVQLNADTGAHYDFVIALLHATDTASITNTAAGTSMVLGVLPGASATASVASGFELTIPCYKNTTFQKSCHSVGSYKIGTASGNLYFDWIGGWWRDTSAINSIKLYPNAGNFEVGTVMGLYGL